MDLIDDSLTEAFEEFQAHPSGFNLSAYCFREQLDFIQDSAHFKTAVCSRRSGKTTACAAHLIHEAVTKQNRICLYITLSRLNAKRIIWTELLSVNRRYSLGGVANETELSMHFPSTNSIIYLTGAKDKSEIEKFRGIPISLCYIDEAQSFRTHLKELIDDVIGPALMDYAGTLCMIGTPGPIPAGYFHECAVKLDTWSKHGWTFWQNPFIAEKSKTTHKELLDRELKRRGVQAEDPSIQREWFGKWVLDSDSLLLHYDHKKNDYTDLPPSKYVYLLGVDIGFEDADALSVLAWSESSPVTYLVDELLINKQGITPLVQQIKYLSEKYQVSKIVMDEGGLGKKIAEEMRRQHGVPIHAADKARKMENVAFLNDALRTGRFKAKKDSRFAQDSYLVEIDRDKTTPDRLVVKSSYHSDIIDAVLYSFKESPAFSYRTPEIKPIPGSQEWANAQVTDMERAAIEHFEKLEEEMGWV